jgi:hypothetical protein
VYDTVVPRRSSATVALALIVATASTAWSAEVLDLQGNLPRLQYKSAGGSLLWTIAANSVLWKVDGPFNAGVIVVTAAAKSSSIIANEGGVSIRGSGFPDAKLHVGNADDAVEPGEVRIDPGNPSATATIHALEKATGASLVLETLKAGGKASLRLASPDATFVQTSAGTYTLRDVNNGANALTVFPGAANDDAIVVRNGKIGLGVKSPANPLQLASGAKCTPGGVWTNASSRTVKHDIVPLTAARARAAVRDLEPVTYAYDADPDEVQVGFVAEDVPELVASNDRKSLSPMDFVAVLTKVVQEQDRQLAAQAEQLRAQGEELARQRAVLAQITRGATSDPVAAPAPRTDPGRDS